MLLRREGFPGQRHCTLPRTVVTAALRNPLLRGLLPTDAGLYPHAEGHYVERNGGAMGTVMIVCVQGTGWMRCRHRNYTLTPGAVALLPPDEDHAYGADEQDPWTIEWTHYSGDEAAAWRRMILGSDSDAGVARVPPARVGEIDLAAVHRELDHGYGEIQLLAAATALRRSLTELARLRHVSGTPPADTVAATTTWMRENLDQTITLAELAKRACLSPSHYSAVFRQRFGYAPIDWLIRQRIQHACRLLHATSDKIEVIGRAVGFTDPYYFTRMFRRVMGLSPREYRSMVKG